jgi:hypothetical protein
MQSSMIKSITEDFGNGGTIDGDLTISGDLQVSGGGSLSFDEIVQGTQVIDVTNTEALLVRKNGDGGDVFVVDTTNSGAGINTSAGGWSLNIKGADANVFKVQASDGNTLSFLQGTNGDATQKWFADGNVTKVLINTNGDSYFTGGSLGVGTASPNELLSVAPDTDVSAEVGRAHIGYIGFSDMAGFSHVDLNAPSTFALAQSSAGKTIVQSKSGQIIAFKPSGSDKVAINSTGLGIGTESPASALAINVTDGQNIKGLHITQLDGGEWTSMMEAEAYGLLIRSTANDTTPALKIQGNGTSNEVLSALSNGKVGIGTDSPDHNLDIVSSGNAEFELTRTSGASIFMQSQSAKGLIGTSSNHNLSFLTNGGTRLTIDTSGDVTFTNTAIFANNKSINFLNTSGAEKAIISFDNSNITKIGDASSSGTLQLNSGNATFAGDVTVNGDTLSLVKSNNNAFLKIESTDGGEAIFEMRATTNRTNQIRFFEGATQRGSIVYAHASQSLTFNTGDSATSKLVLDDNSRISLSNNDSGSNNTIFGKSASPSQAGANNTIIGENTALAMDGGESHNIVIGNNAMRGADEGASGTIDFNVAIGSSALWGGVLSGTEQVTGNIAIGYQALYKTDDTNASLGQVAIGYQSLKSTTSGNFNTAIGYTSGTALTEGLNNTTVGYQSMLGITTGDNNTAIGSKSLNSAQTSQNNVAVGYLALEELTFNGNSYNTALGVQSGQELTSGIKNTFVGAFSGYTSTDVDNAVAVGYNAGGSVMTSDADGTVAIGTFALDALTSGARNLAVGYNAGTGITTGTDNTLVGWGAGDALLTAASNNTIIGAEAEASSTGASDQIVIGKAAVGQGTNTVVLGKSSVSAIYCARNASASVEASAFNVGSDRKLKKNIRDTALQGVNLIERMQVRDFEWKDNDVTVNGGLIAQELEAIYPDAVGKRNDDGDDGDVTMTISRESIVPLLIKAVQELSAKVKELESK